MRRRAFLSAALAAGLPALAGCQGSLDAGLGGGGAGGEDGPDCELRTDRGEQLEIGEHAFGTSDTSGLPRVKGTIENTGDVRVTYAEVRATFYAANGSEIDAGIDRRINVDPGETQTFRVYPDEVTNASEIDDYELSLGDVEACVPPGAG